MRKQSTMEKRSDLCDCVQTAIASANATATLTLQLLADAVAIILVRAQSVPECVKQRSGLRGVEPIALKPREKPLLSRYMLAGLRDMPLCLGKIILGHLPVPPSSTRAFPLVL